MKYFLKYAFFNYELITVHTIFQAEIIDGKLSSLNVDGVCKLLQTMEDLNKDAVAHYVTIIQNHNINGRVLTSCDLDELKDVRVLL